MGPVLHDQRRTSSHRSHSRQPCLGRSCQLVLLYRPGPRTRRRFRYTDTALRRSQGAAVVPRIRADRLSELIVVLSRPTGSTPCCASCGSYPVVSPATYGNLVATPATFD